MEAFKKKLQTAGFRGEVLDDPTSKELYSHDASLFEIRPQLVVCPLDSQDVQVLVQAVAAEKAALPDLSLTARSAGTDMSGGAVNDSVIIDFSKHFTAIEAVSPTEAKAQPGVFYRDFEKRTLEHNALMPTYPASRDLCTIGGMVSNDAGGEKSLEYGKTEDFVKQLKVVLADGKEYTLGPLSKPQLVKKMAQQDFEGRLYKRLFELLDKNYEVIQASRPTVSKNSMGYNVWDAWNRDTGVFDITKLFVGSQGTLGFVTDITFKLVPTRPYSGLLVCFMKDIAPLGQIVEKTLKHKPATFESFDDETLYLALKHLSSFKKYVGVWGLIKLFFSLIPDIPVLFKGIPKLILMVEFNGNTQAEVDEKINKLYGDLAPFDMVMEREETAAKSKKFWIMRRQSFNLIRSKVKDKHAAMFIDDLVVAPPHLVEFIPRLRQLIKKYQLNATIAGHMGDGNFHIIPLMNMEIEKEKILPAMEEIDDLVLHYKGSLSGEHNDGLVRGPWLEDQFGKEVVDIFREIKAICDPENMFNPHKKTDADWDYSYKYIREHF